MIRTKIPFLIFFLICNAIFIYINSPMISMVKNHPVTTYYTMPHHGIMDYYLYISYIRDSMQGSWVTRNFFAAEANPVSLFYLYFIVLGKIAAVFQITPFLAYHLGRIISTELIITGVYALCSEVLGRRWGLLAAFLGMFSTIPPIRAFPHVFAKYIPFEYWSYMGPAGRLDYLPHHGFGIALLLWTLFFLMRYYRLKKHSGLVPVYIGSFLSGVFFPPAGLVMVFATALTLFVDVLHRIMKKNRIRVKPYLQYVLIILLAALSLGIMKLQTMLGFPWSQWKDWDMYIWNDLKGINTLIVLGSAYMLMFSLPAVVYHLLKGKSLKYVYLGVWALLPYILLPFTNLIGIGRIRVIFMGNFVPLGIMSVLSVQYLMHILRKRSISRIIIPLFLIAFGLLAYPDWKYSADKIATPDHMVFYNTTIPASMMKSYEYINNFIPGDSVFLGSGWGANIIPAFAPVKVYCGHETQTRNFWDKEPVIQKFYRGEMNLPEVAEFLKNTKAQYIYYGPMEWQYGMNIPKYNLPLEKIYDSEGVVIFKVP